MEILQTEKLYKLFKNKKNEIFYKAKGKWSLIETMEYMNFHHMNPRQIVITIKEDEKYALLKIEQENIKVVREIDWEEKEKLSILCKIDWICDKYARFMINIDGFIIPFFVSTEIFIDKLKIRKGDEFYWSLSSKNKLVNFNNNKMLEPGDISFSDIKLPEMK